MKKIRKFSVFEWKNILMAGILYNLILCGGSTAAAEEGFPDGAEPLGVTVRVKPEDAERQRLVNSLRREAASAKETLAKLELENRALRESERRSREELIELTNKYQQQNEQYHQLRLGLAGALASGQVRSAGEREDRLFRAMGDTAVSGGALALKAVKFCELVEATTRDLPIGKVKQAELRLKQEDLTRDARRFIALTSPQPEETALEKCRILAVDPELSVVVLSVGSVHGAFHGLMYYVGKDKVALKVIGVRSFVSAARPVSGGIDGLTPGMEAVTESK